MSIINSISTGGGGAWTAVANTAASSAALTFTVTRAPSDWIVFKRTTQYGSTSRIIIYISKDSGGTAWYNYWLYRSGSQYTLQKGDRSAGSYDSSNNTFVVSNTYSESFTTTVGDYVLVYI